MARGAKSTKKRTIQPDAVYGSILVAKLINNIMKDGKKTVAQSLVYKAFNLLAANPSASHSTVSSDRIGSGPSGALDLFEKAVQNVGPKTEIKARRVGGANYQIPIEVKGERKTALALRWIIESARTRSNKDYHTFAEKLAAEIIDASQNIGDSIKKRDNVHRMAEANKAFSHFRI